MQSGRIGTVREGRSEVEGAVFEDRWFREGMWTWTWTRVYELQTISAGKIKAILG